MESKSKGRLYLIPSSLDEHYSPDQLAVNAYPQIEHLSHFAVENLRHARRYLRKLNPALSIDDCQFFEIGKHAAEIHSHQVIQILKSGTDVGVISEAGLPAVADPGNNLVGMAHANGIMVHPLIGPGSIFLALMASGFNGQQFSFHGYLPRKGNERIQRIKSLEQSVMRTGYTQIFMETPYRNDALLEDLLNHCSLSTGLCIACDITGVQEEIWAGPISEWKQKKRSYHKRPAIFMLGKF